MLVSVLLPFHGESPYLGEAIQSVLDQTLSDFELLLINDHASTSSKKLVRSFQQRDSRIKVINCKVPGLGAALNLGLGYSSGTFVARLDDDDTMSRTRLELQYRAMAADSSLVCLGSQVLYIKDGVELSTSRLPIYDWQIKFESKISNPMAHPSLMIRKDGLDQIGGYNPDFTVAQDYEMYTRLMPLGRMRNLRKPLTNYRIHDNQISSKMKNIRIPFELAALESRHFPIPSIQSSSQFLQSYVASNDPEALFIKHSHVDPKRSRAILKLRQAVSASSPLDKVFLVLHALRKCFFLGLVYLFSKSVTSLEVFARK